MNILLVDDEHLTLETLLTRLDWSRFQFAHIFTAKNITEARSLLLSETIEIILCDIEMPGGTGFDLVSWIRSQNIPTQCIFLTCYADFSYARKALKLGSIDYILKPIIPEEVEDSIAKAISRQEESQALQLKTRSWQQSLPAIYRQFWMELLDGTTSPDESSVSQQIYDLQLDIGIHSHFYAILLTAISGSASRFPRKHHSRNQRLLEKICGSAPCTCYLIPQTDDSYFLILESSDDDCPLPETGDSICRSFLNQIKDDEELRYYCYLGWPENICQLPEQMEALQTLAYQNVVLEQQLIYSVHSQDLRTLPPDTPVQAWSELLESDDFSGFLKAITSYLLQPSIKRQMTSDFLEHFSLEYYQLLVTYAYRHQLLLTYILPPEECLSYTSQATASLNQMLSWVKYSTRTLESAIHSHQRELTPVDKIKSYIKKHIRDSLTVSAISEYVHMNSSYLARVFKKETGCSIHQYIQEQKMQQAMQDMKTSKPIGEIALDLGYQSYSSFQKTFTRIVGISPKEYKYKLSEGACHET